MPQARAELHVPSGWSSRGGRPLLVMLHGCRQDARTFAAGTGMNALADQHQFAVLYPEQNRSANPLGCWNWFHPRTVAGGGDAAAIVSLVRSTVRRLKVDPRRVYLAGMSAGGAMAGVLAACHGSLFAACAIHSGVMYASAGTPSEAMAAMSYGSIVAPADSARQARRAGAQRFAFVPTLVIHGDQDTTVHPLNAEQIIAHARALAEVEGDVLVEAPLRRHVAGERVYRVHEYVRRGRLALRKVIVEGLGHAWSGGDDRHPFNDAAAPCASRLIWDFVSRFWRPSDGRGARPIPMLLRLVRG